MGPPIGRSTCPVADSGSHWPSGRSLGRREAGTGGITQAPSPPLASWWCPHLSCEVLSKIESSCTLACFHVGPRIHVLRVWTVEGKHTWIQGFGLTPWSMPWLMQWRGVSRNRPNYKSSSVETVDKQSSFQTWAHIIPVVNWNHEGFQTNS